jgi:hypothetical protein
MKYFRMVWQVEHKRRDPKEEPADLGKNGYTKF